MCNKCNKEALKKQILRRLPLQIWNSILPHYSKTSKMTWKDGIKLPPTLIGCISTVQTKILLKINYLPWKNVNPPPGWFSSLNSTVYKFYWKDKRPMIKITTLKKPKQYIRLVHQMFTNTFSPTSVRISNTGLTTPILPELIYKDLHIQHTAFIDKTVKSFRSIMTVYLFMMGRIFW